MSETIKIRIGEKVNLGFFSPDISHDPTTQLVQHVLGIRFTIFSPGLNNKPAQPVVKLLLPAHHQMGWQLHRIVSKMFLPSFAPLCLNGDIPASRLFHRGWNCALLSLLYSGITFIHKATILSIAGEFRNT